MQDKKLILAPAKLNIFLKVLGKRKDEFHEIRSGITFINLFDQIEIEQNNKTTISYKGKFKPKKNTYNNCIIKKTLDFLNIKKKFQFKINIIKNIPVQGGLGSASTNAAALIKALEEMNLIEKRKPSYYAMLGADIPSFLFNSDCLVTGMGEKIFYYHFPKYYFLLVKPRFNNSTKIMYKKLGFKKNTFNLNLLSKNNEINDEDRGNDFSKLVANESIEYKKIILYLENLDNAIFANMTGSGSCCYVAFEKKEYALKAIKFFKVDFPDLWAIVCENNK